MSRPVIVRTYSGPPRSRHGSGSRGSSRRRPYYASAAGAYSRASQQSASGSRYGYGIPVVGGLLSMGRANRSKTAGGPAASGAAGAAGPAEGKMPPLEAFTFKGILAKIENDIGGDLDSIAEICARSRLSLSNQYEVHVPPHGSGAAFLQSASSAAVSRRDQRGKHSAANSGPLTLQAVPSDDENNRHASRRRRGGPGRRRSAAMGTLETIMSSSRSSEEGKTNKKPAAEIVEEVRGRHAAAQAKANSGQAKANGHSNSPPSPSSSKSDPDAKAGIAGAGAWHESSSRRKTLAFTAALMMDSTRQHSPGQSSSRESGARDDGKRKSSSPSPASSSPTTSKPEHPSSALLSEPALPQTSNSHLEIRTTSAGSNPQTPTITATGNSRDRGVNGNGHGRHAHESNASAALAILDEPRAQSELLDQQLREQPGVLAGLVASWVLPLRTVMGLGPSSPRQSSPSLRTPGSSEQQRSQPPGSPRHSGSPAGGFGPFPFPGKHSQAEGSLRELLRSAEERAAAAAAAREAAVVDAKGKGVDRGGAVS